MTWENILKKPFDASNEFTNDMWPYRMNAVLKKYLDPYVRRAFAENRHARAIDDKKPFSEIYEVNITQNAMSGWPFEVLKVFEKLTKEKLEKLYNIDIVEFDASSNIKNVERRDAERGPRERKNIVPKPNTRTEQEFRYKHQRRDFYIKFKFTLRG